MVIKLFAFLQKLSIAIVCILARKRCKRLQNYKVLFKIKKLIAVFGKNQRVLSKFMALSAPMRAKFLTPSMTFLEISSIRSI